jgi:hypothetical protein
MAWVLKWGQLFWFWPMVLNQHTLFLAIPTDHINTYIILGQRKQYNRHQSILGKMFMSNGFSGATTLTRITLKFTIVKTWQNNQAWTRSDFWLIQFLLKRTICKFQTLPLLFFLVILKNTVTVQVTVISVQPTEQTSSKQKSMVYLV